MSFASAPRCPTGRWRNTLPPSISRATSVEGAWDDNLLTGVAHVAVYLENDHPVGELGISVLTEARHRRLGRRLLARTLVHARLQGLRRVNVLFLTRNRSMVRLAREFTNRVETTRGDAHATIDLTEPALAAA